MVVVDRSSPWPREPPVSSLRAGLKELPLHNTKHQDLKRVMRPGVKVNVTMKDAPPATSASLAVANGAARSQARGRGIPRKVRTMLLCRHRRTGTRANWPVRKSSSCEPKRPCETNTSDWWTSTLQQNTRGRPKNRPGSVATINKLRTFNPYSIHTSRHQGRSISS